MTVGFATVEKTVGSVVMMGIRTAQPQDSAQIAPLIAMIYRDMEMPVLKNVSEADLLAMLTELYQRPANLDGLAQTFVAVMDHKIVGVAFGHLAKNEVAVNDLLRTTSGHHAGFEAPLELGGETRPNEWYLSMLAVDPQAQGHGVGSALLEALPGLVGQLGATKLSLNVDDGNPRAAKLYHRHGFVPDGQLMIGTHPYQHLVKPLS
ncbi:GNAT family N-acetyltransferase [Lactiplantibacillus plantarum]|uniref:GNAT family N-acetyltransferase n=2 Tax=Lactiplantibacillus plantarum TaxID=1590 RepID=UPI00203B98EF|nr:GNAT family N-acetyltransferase [Lactiplantibacillus plantarum]MCM2585687.1 GNAT family N-acetyltransferase [Lactiplantibacillus plantarum]MCM2615061.1 GNAT family N-acetyltransferase [Lactiplantibacillus plantarum]MCM2618028.1 GNAT family N-acetyltransferase [Lactiplantibacillus plantarum]MCM2630116.1 GNAT family N-acetyltransferase [Lactiplantibacillus plantarum]MCM2639159.1 GNAT family N-acetyltransferase [Lactiplantibacillus plantarum]